MDGWMHEWIDVEMGGWMDIEMDGWVDGGVNGRVDRWMDQWHTTSLEMV